MTNKWQGYVLNVQGIIYNVWHVKKEKNYK